MHVFQTPKPTPNLADELAFYFNLTIPRGMEWWNNIMAPDPETVIEINLYWIYRNINVSFSFAIM